MRALSVLFLLGTLLVSSLANAQTNDVERLIYNLANSEDFRVRTQAALALGASKNELAVTPLCSALADSNTTVRAASAAALGRLVLPAAQGCLEKRLDAEPSEVVKAAIQKALDIIRSGGAGAEPVFAGDTKFYISIGKTSDKTGRSGDEVDRLVRKAMMAKVGQTPGFLAAPPGETQAQAKKRLDAHKGVKGYFLSPVITAEYLDDALKVKIDVAMATYPDKAVFRQFSFYQKMGGVSPGSTSDENDLIQGVAERAIEKFAAVAASR